MLGDARFDPTKIQWLGSLSERPGVVAVWHSARATTLEDAKKIALNLGSTGVGAGNFQIPTLANALLGTRFKVVMGYPGGSTSIWRSKKAKSTAASTIGPAGRRQSRTGSEMQIVFLFRTGPHASDMPDGLPAFR